MDPLTKLLATIEPVATSLPVPLVFMVYYNQIVRRGLRRFMEEVKAGGAGLIIPIYRRKPRWLRGLAAELDLSLNFLAPPPAPRKGSCWPSQQAPASYIRFPSKG